MSAMIPGAKWQTRTQRLALGLEGAAAPSNKRNCVPVKIAKGSQVVLSGGPQGIHVIVDGRDVGPTTSFSPYSLSEMYRFAYIPADIRRQMINAGLPGTQTTTPYGTSPAGAPGTKVGIAPYDFYLQRAGCVQAMQPSPSVPVSPHLPPSPHSPPGSLEGAGASRPPTAPPPPPPPQYKRPVPRPQEPPAQKKMGVEGPSGATVAVQPPPLPPPPPPEPFSIQPSSTSNAPAKSTTQNVKTLQVKALVVTVGDETVVFQSGPKALHVTVYPSGAVPGKNYYDPGEWFLIRPPGSNVGMQNVQVVPPTGPAPTFFGGFRLDDLLSQYGEVLLQVTAPGGSVGVYAGGSFRGAADWASVNGPPKPSRSYPGGAPINARPHPGPRGALAADTNATSDAVGTCPACPPCSYNWLWAIPGALLGWGATVIGPELMKKRRR